MQVNLTVRFYDRYKGNDLKFLNSWLKERGHKELERFSLPPIGVVVLEEETPIAVCFLRRCEGLLGIIDGLATNPAAASALRHEAIDTAVRVIIEQARIYGITALVAWSKDAGTLVRAFDRHGFRQLPDTMIIKDLEAHTKH